MADLTVKDARAALQASLMDGATCPCCKQHVRAYRRKLNSNMARFLISLVRAADLTVDDGWVHYARCRFKGRDYNYLDVGYFGLAEQRPNDDEAKRTSGFWRPTALGWDFVMNRCKVPSHIVVYNGVLLRYEGSLVGVRDALGSTFNYTELMEGD